MRRKRYLLMVALLWSFQRAECADTLIQCKGCFLRILREADVASRDHGDIDQIHIEVGQLVKKDQTLASLSQKETGLLIKIAESDLSVAEHEMQQDKQVEILASKKNEFEKLVNQATFESKMAYETSMDDTSVRLAEAAYAFSRGEYQRALEARERLKATMSERELRELALKQEQDQIRVAKAKLELKLSQLMAEGATSKLEAHQAASKRVELELAQSVADRETAKLTIGKLSQAVALAKLRHDRRGVVAPFDGMVTDQQIERGEWVESGETMFRVIQLSPLAVEGFIDIKSSRLLKRGMTVVISVEDIAEQAATYKGTLTLIDPQVDTVNREVRIQATIPNADLILRPGTAVGMTIDTEQSVPPEESRRSVAQGER